MGMNAVYEGAQDCPEAIPLFPLGGALLLPRGQMPLNIFEPRYLKMIDDALRGERIIGMVQPDGESAITASQIAGETPPSSAARKRTEEGTPRPAAARIAA